MMRPMQALPAHRGARLTALVTLTFLTGLFLVYAVEFGLWWTDPRRGLPFDGDKNGIYYTWGHPWTVQHRIIWNGWHFRTRRFDVPKPKGLRRVMVVGDSLTFGVGLGVAERYTELLEGRLNERTEGHRWEVVNLGLMGAPTVFERDVVVGFGPMVDPDRIVVGFCNNDVDPAKKYPTEEHRRFEERHGPWITAVEKTMSAVALPRLATRFRRAASRWGELSGRFPDYREQLRRAYAADAPTWKDFTGALADIKEFCDKRRLPPPIFAVLVSPHSSEEFRRPNADQAFLAELNDQAARAAAGLGFVVVRFEPAVAALPPDQALNVNPADGHPGAVLNRLFADGLADALSPDRPSQEN